jgi:hypothetical protein
MDRTRYYPFAFEIIDVPCGVKLNPGGRGFKNDPASNVLGAIGAIVDAYELYSIYNTERPEIPAFVDIIFGGTGSIAAGETYLAESPHPELPNGVVLGQDFWVATIDWGVASAADKALPSLGTAIGGTVANADGPSPISEGVGYLVGKGAAKGVDTYLTGYGLYSDLSRTPFNVKHQWLSPIPTQYAAGVMWEDIPFLVLLRYECSPTYCE